MDKHRSDQLQGTNSSKSCRKEYETLTWWPRGHPSEQLFPRYIGGSHHHEDEELQKISVIWSNSKDGHHTQMKS